MKKVSFMVLAALVAFLGCNSESPAPESNKPDPSGGRVAAEPEDYNAVAFRKARQSVTAAMKYNWSTANTILDTIDVNRITDTDTLAYVDYCKRCARVAQEIGVTKDSVPGSVTDTASNLDLMQFTAAVWTTIEEKGIAETAQVAADAKRVRDEIPMWKQLDAKLTARYGLEESRPAN